MKWNEVVISSALGVLVRSSLSEDMASELSGFSYDPRVYFLEY
jgi:hypothetical protein